MKFGTVFPTCEIGSDRIAIRDYAQAAESLGYAHIIAYDHILGAPHEGRKEPLFGPYTEKDPFHEPFVLFGFLSAVTTRITLATGVLILPQRQVALVAKQAAELAVLSGNRLRLGVGTGWNFVEYEALGVPFSARGKRLDEQVSVLRKLWTEPLVEFGGEYHRIDRASISPRPSSPIPVWFGGGAAAIDRAARIGDGFVFGASMPATREVCRELNTKLEEYGRKGGFGIDVLLGFGDGPDHWRSEIAAWQELGADSLTVRTMSTASALLGEKDPGFTTPRQHIDALETFISAVS